MLARRSPLHGEVPMGSIDGIRVHWDTVYHLFTPTGFIFTPFLKNRKNPTRGHSDAFREHITALPWHSRRRGAAPPPGAIGRSKKSRSRRRGTAKLRARGALTGVGTFGHCDKASSVGRGDATTAGTRQPERILSLWSIWPYLSVNLQPFG